jgi:MFS family permease
MDVMVGQGHRLLSAWRNVVVLSLSQALALSCAVLAVTVGPLVGASLAANPAFATLPVALTVVGALLTTVPASFLMRRLGRRIGFALGALIGALGGVLAAAAIHAGSFTLFALAFVLIGAFQGFTGYFRFAAAESVPEERRSRAIAWVLAGGVVAALLGPQMAIWGKDFVADRAFLGAFLLLSAFCVAIAGLMAGLDLPRVAVAASAHGGRPLSVIARQPVFLVAVIGATVGYAVMLLVMTATPLAMVDHHHAVGDAVHVIQAHVLAMFAPSFFSGSLVRRFGAIQVLLAGLALLAANALVAASGTDLGHFFWALVLLGMGWNFTYVAGTALLTEACVEQERAKTQAANEVILQGFVALASLASGWLLASFGWQVLALSALPPLIIAAAVAARLLGRRRREDRSRRHASEGASA